jgi:acyl-CoA thioester hydrolase
MARLTLALPDQFHFTTTLKVRVNDLNYGAHVGNDNILTLCQQARIELYRQCGFANEISFDKTIGQIIADALVIYKGEAFLGDELQIEITHDDINKYGFDLLYRITRMADNKEIARAKTGVICFDYATRKVAAIPEIVKEKLLR